MEGISLRPSDAQHGGFLDDVDVTFKECRFVEWDYRGKATRPSVALRVLMEDAEGGQHEQYYSAGDPSKVKPSDDGTMVVSTTGAATRLNNNTNAMALITSLVNAGYPEDRITNDASQFDGLEAHVNQVAQPKRSGLKDEKEGVRTYILVSKILKLPWEAVTAKPAKGAPAPKAAGPRPVAATSAPVASPAPPTGGDPGANGLGDKARMTIMQVLLEKNGAVQKAKLPTECFRTLASDPDRNSVVSLVHKNEFPAAAAVAEGIFAYDPATDMLSLP